MSQPESQTRRTTENTDDDGPPRAVKRAIETAGRAYFTACRKIARTLNHLGRSRQQR